MFCCYYKNTARRDIPQIVAYVLAQYYPGSFDTPILNTLIDLVHHKVGADVPYKIIRVVFFIMFSLCVIKQLRLLDLLYVIGF